jgi:hypothetical protein
MVATLVTSVTLCLALMKTYIVLTALLSATLPAFAETLLSSLLPTMIYNLTRYRA